MKTEAETTLNTFAFDMQNRLGCALDGIAALHQFARSADWEGGPEQIERLRSAFEWTIDRMKADLDAALLAVMEIPLRGAR